MLPASPDAAALPCSMISTVFTILTFKFQLVTSSSCRWVILKIIMRMRHEDCIVTAEREQQQQVAVETIASNIDMAHFDTNTEPVASCDIDRPVEVREKQCHCSKSIRGRVRIRAQSTATATAVTVLLLSTLAVSVVYFDHFSLISSYFTMATSMLKSLLGSTNGAQVVLVHEPSPASVVPVEMHTMRQRALEENMLNILRRQEDETRFRRQEEILRREHIARNRQTRMEAQEEKQREAEEQKRVGEENRLRMLQREGEERLRREEERMLRKKHLARERQARIDAQEDKKRMMTQDQGRVSVHLDLQGDEFVAVLPPALNQETEVAEAVAIDERQPLHVRRLAKLYTFVY